MLPVDKQSVIVLEERDKILAVDNRSRSRFTMVRFDGCVVKHATGADWLLIKENNGTHLIIELKGRNVEHAIDQLRATTQFLICHGIDTQKISAVVICRQYPHASTLLQRKEAAYTREFRVPIRFASKKLVSRYEVFFHVRVGRQSTRRRV